MKRILIIDNYDSFVFNIVQLLRESALCPQIEVVKNTDIPFHRLDSFQGIVLSPGPGIPAEAGSLPKLLEQCATTHPLLGICLGHQAIVEHFGGTIINLHAPLHGHCSHLKITDSTDPLLRGIGEGAAIGRYHSWSADPATLPPCLRVSATDEEGNIMAIRHTSLPIYGLQFHPESYISACGARIIDNWLEMSLS